MNKTMEINATEEEVTENASAKEIEHFEDAFDNLQDANGAEEQVTENQNGQSKSNNGYGNGQTHDASTAFKWTPTD